jgi:hypothetical protein
VGKIFPLFTHIKFRLSYEKRALYTPIIGIVNGRGHPRKACSASMEVTGFEPAKAVFHKRYVTISELVGLTFPGPPFKISSPSKEKPNSCFDVLECPLCARSPWFSQCWE